MTMNLLTLSLCFIFFSAALYWAIRDYGRWKALGPGGLPHSLIGWLSMAGLRLLKRDGRNPKRLDSALSATEEHSYLGAVVRRQGMRPRVAPHPIPHRQLSETISQENLKRLQSLFDERVEANRETVQYKQSFFEKHHAAITLHDPRCGHVFALISHGEIAHIHPSDGSMHMVLSPSDAKQVLTHQWGELHSLAGFMNRLPSTYTFIYAPRTDEDFSTVKRILDASIAFMAKHPRSA